MRSLLPDVVSEKKRGMISIVHSVTWSQPGTTALASYFSKHSAYYAIDGANWGILRVIIDSSSLFVERSVRRKLFNAAWMRFFSVFSEALSV